MTKAKRGSGSHRGVSLCAIAALGLALSGCGGGAAGNASTAQASASGPGAAAATGSLPDSSGKAVTINWTPPTENTNGTALTDLAGYDILYGTASGYYTQKISVPNAGISTYVVDDLGPGTYYFSVAAVNSAGTESPLSTEVKATVN